MMKHTENYKLNLIETTDTFSPEPLNQNMETLEQALGELAGRNDAGDAQTTALAKRITSLEGHYFKTGTFTGNGGDQTVYLGFAPKWVIISVAHSTCALIPGVAFSFGNAKAAEIRGNGFYIYSSDNLFRSNTCTYVAFS